MHLLGHRWANPPPSWLHLPCRPDWTDNLSGLNQAEV